MTTPAMQPIIEFHTDRKERLALGALLILTGVGALAFWWVERNLHWPLLLILTIGALFVCLGLFLMGFRRRVRLERGRGASEVRSLFGVTLSQRLFPLTDFEAVGSHGATTEILSLDVVLFRHDGGHLTLRTMLGDAQAKSEIARVAACLGLPAEAEPRVRIYPIGR